MSKPRILHMIFPGANVSPFDVNMAADAGYQILMPYTRIGLDDVGGLIQDAIFSRPPRQFDRTGAFFGGWDVNLAADMLERARQSLVPPFEMSLFADPNGAYTTSAALVALVGKHLRARDDATDQVYRDRSVRVFGGGPVGLCAAVLIAQQGGRVTLVRLTPPRDDKQDAITRFCRRYDVTLDAADGETDAAKAAALRDADVVITTAKAGVQILSRALLGQAPRLLAAADVNAVPPTGIEGLQPGDDGVDLGLDSGAVGVGALAIGAIKYKTQHGLLKQMLDTDRALTIDFPDAYRFASGLV